MMNWNGRYMYPQIVNQQIMESSDDETVVQYIRRKERQAYESEAESEEEFSNSSSESEEEEEEETETEPSQQNSSEENSSEAESNNSGTQPTEEEDDEGSGSNSSEISPGESEEFIEHLDIYTSSERATGKTFLHLRQLIPRAKSCNKEDVFFPIDQSDQVLDSLNELIAEKIPEDENEKKSFLVNGITTSHVEVWLEYSPDFDDYSIFLRCLQNNAYVSFPKKHGTFYSQRMEWYRNTHIPVKYLQDNYNYFYT